MIDFESYFDADYTLSKMQTISYITDERFELTGMGCQFNDASGIFYKASEVGRFLELFKTFFGKNFERVTVVVKNAGCDIQILQTRFGIIPKYIIDVEDLTRFYDSRMPQKLEKVAKTFLKDEAKGDTMQFKGLHYADMTEIQLFNLAEYCKNDIKLEYQLFQKFLPFMTNPKLELWLARHTLNLSLNPTLILDSKKAARLQIDMREELDTLIERVDWIKQKGKTTLQVLRSTLLFPEVLQNELPEGEFIPMKKGTKKMIPALAKSDEGFQQLLVHPCQRVRELCQAKQAAKSWPTHIKKIEKMKLAAMACSGKLPIPLKFYGGHTGRWSGKGGWNPQNLGGKGRAGAATHPLIREVRSLLCAPSGYTLGISDSKQIEVRVAAWLAGEKKISDGFAKGEDIYSQFASKLFGHTVYNDVSDDPKLIADLMSIERGFGKDAILGCGYGMGTSRFYNNCYSNPSLRPLFDSGQFDWAFIDKLIKTYRTTYSKIPAFWADVENAFKFVIKYPGKEAKLPHLHFANAHGTVIITLPSGRDLYYRHCTINHGKEICWQHGRTWGGGLTENLCQAVARDLLAEWMYAIEQAGIHIVLHAHDEVVALLPEKEAKGLLSKMGELMCKRPVWAKDLPLGIDSQLSDRYKK